MTKLAELKKRVDESIHAYAVAKSDLFNAEKHHADKKIRETLKNRLHEVGLRMKDAIRDYRKEKNNND